jgi:hypothetical protein
MPYSFSQANNVLAIPERQYATSNEIRFAGFSSCIGLIAKTGNNLTGIHLAMMDDQDHWFDAAAADIAITMLGVYERVVVIGQVPIWEDTATVSGAYARLVANLNNPRIISRDDGVYGARVHNNTFQTYEQGAYINVPGNRAANRGCNIL